jgi:hypothetical protein
LLLVFSAILLHSNDNAEFLHTFKITFTIFFFACTSIALLYVAVQFASLRKALVDVIGLEAFAFYIGLNPGSKMAARGVLGFLGIGAALAIAGYGNGIGNYYNNKLIIDGFIENAQRAARAGAPIDPETLQRLHKNHDFFKVPNAIIENLFHDLEKSTGTGRTDSLGLHHKAAESKVPAPSIVTTPSKEPAPSFASAPVYTESKADKGL